MVEERFVLGKITKERFEKFREKYVLQRARLIAETQKNQQTSSNLEKAVQKALKIG